jgi:pyroglutamyl-peptidase
MNESVRPSLANGEPEPSRVAVVGFEPFDGRTKNRSWELARKLRGRGATDVYCLPVDFSRIDALVAGILVRAPKALLMIGESPIQELRVEQIALNVADSEREDNAGRIPHGEEVIPGGPLALKTSWDARAVAGRLHQEGIPASVSYHAGTFACNAALYCAISRLEKGDPSVASKVNSVGRIADAPAAGTETAIGFFHIPNRRGPTGLGSENLIRAAEVGLQELLDVSAPLGGGAA